MTRTWIGAVIALGLLASCGNGGTDEEALRKAVTSYSNAYLTGDADTAYAQLSARCVNRTTVTEFAELVSAAETAYGSALPLATYSANISGDLARVTYTYADATINQESEPWVKESGKWKQDDC